jgi:hypothetical protein
VTFTIYEVILSGFLARNEFLTDNSRRIEREIMVESHPSRDDAVTAVRRGVAAWPPIRHFHVRRGVEPAGEIVYETYDTTVVRIDGPPVPLDDALTRLGFTREDVT